MKAFALSAELASKKERLTHCNSNSSSDSVWSTCDGAQRSHCDDVSRMLTAYVAVTL